MNVQPDTSGVAGRSWLQAHKWLVARRVVQCAIVAVFLAGPLLGVWIVKGNLAGSLVFDRIPLADPLILSQSILAGHAPGRNVVIGALIVAAFYALAGGRVYCSWVCPINIISDSASWLRQRLGIPGGGIRLQRNSRVWLLGLVLLLSIATGSIIWELVNPVTIVFRGLVFGGTGAALVAIAILLFDTFIARRGWCGHLCPVGAAYGFIGARSLIKMAATRRDQCNDCMDCFVVCPEPHVIKPALKGSHEPIIVSADCSNCGRCIDVCSQHVFEFTTRYHQART